VTHSIHLGTGRGAKTFVTLKLEADNFLTRLDFCYLLYEVSFSPSSECGDLGGGGGGDWVFLKHKKTEKKKKGGPHGVFLATNPEKK
jgi:hypothetical protein